MRRLSLYILSGILLLGSGIGCKSNKKNGNMQNDGPNREGVTEVDPDVFIKEGLVEPITKVEKTLSDGTVATCYKITTTSVPTEHPMGPWCPTHITDGPDKGGKWFENGELYDVDGAFIENMADFYSDATWKMYDEEGNIFVTQTLEDCENAANPNVGEEYENFCVECQPSFVSDVSITYYIPVTPVKLDTPDYFNRGARGGGRPPADRKGNGPPPDRKDHQGPPPGGGGGSVVGLALNGVNFDPPAPTSEILGAYTLAPMDDNGGHINPNTGYHYHAATGMTAKVEQADGHAALIGYALDGFPMFERLDENGNEPTDLDDCRGHTDDIRGYHYHVAAAGTNSFIGCFSGAQGTFEIN
ncbi:YHYH protein [Pseudozobellia thermophila]|nr:YHYH protein [Pseudozobellia thermophila]